MRFGIVKGKKHSYNNFDITIKEKNIGIPTKNKILETVPFMNGTYDFSAIYGEQSYSERELSYVFNVVAKNKVELNVKKTKIIDWLMTTGKEKLYDDAFPGYYFLAECISVDFVEKKRHGEMAVKFAAYPFMIKEEYEGTDLWDDFNFELDISQQTMFNVKKLASIEIYNSGSSDISPSINATSDMQIIKDDITYKVKAGISKSYQFKLKKGINKLKIIGSGNIEFLFNKEMI